MTSTAGLLRIDPGTARLTAPNPGPVSAIAAGAGGVWAVCCQGRGPRWRVDPVYGRQVAAANDGGLWLGTAQGLFHLDQRILRQR